MLIDINQMMWRGFGLKVVAIWSWVVFELLGDQRAIPMIVQDGLLGNQIAFLEFLICIIVFLHLATITFFNLEMNL